MNLLAFFLVAAALLLGVIVAVMARKEPATASFLLGVGLAACSLGVIVQDVFIHLKHVVHS